MSARLRLGLILILVVIIVDQASKYWILLRVMNPPKIISVTPYFNIVLTWNRGVSFGLFNNEGNLGVWIFSILALFIVVILLFWLWTVESKLIAASLGAIIGGALGNVIDRATHLAVMDFLDFHLGGMHWPAFNVADSFITSGAVVLIVDSLFSRRKAHTNISGSGETGN